MGPVGWPIRTVGHDHVLKFKSTRGEMNAGVGRNIPWSNAERSGEMTKFMALTRWLRGGSPFYTVSPDPVHNIATIQ